MARAPTPAQLSAEVIDTLPARVAGVPVLGLIVLKFADNNFRKRESSMSSMLCAYTKLK